MPTRLPKSHQSPADPLVMQNLKTSSVQRSNWKEQPKVNDRSTWINERDEINHFCQCNIHYIVQNCAKIQVIVLSLPWKERFTSKDAAGLLSRHTRTNKTIRATASLFSVKERVRRGKSCHQTCLHPTHWCFNFVNMLYFLKLDYMSFITTALSCSGLRGQKLSFIQ